MESKMKVRVCFFCGSGMYKNPVIVYFTGYWDCCQPMNNVVYDMGLALRIEKPIPIK